jgi:hypothetical protein
MPVRLNTHQEKASAPARTAAAPETNPNPSLGVVGVLRLDPVNSRKHHGENGNDNSSDIDVMLGDDTDCAEGDEDCEIEEANCLKCS